MSQQASGTYTTISWDETPYAEAENGTTLTHAHVTFAYAGAITGEGVVDYVMVYPADTGQGFFHGYERIVGTLDGREGSFVVDHEGDASGPPASSEWRVRSTWRVIEGAGTGALASLTGTGGYTAVHGEPEVPYTLTYEPG
jgi:hypothetical protein